ncbi:hypothetical protein [Bifidobacterium vespertilionis]|uniref:hypothetical protein n=1 Tax=Bifidobacterium vespertilionis TaxID=2562524 RepID=UPI001BDCB2B7|nr:hypothetical protein [Bifidobacterium vespertilionis]MBT1179703.1 hypothetical protein [Bifidobacterium vespertilionis]
MPITSSATLLTQRETALRLGVSERRVTALRQAHEITALPVGAGGFLITASSVQRYERWAGKPGRPYSAAMAFAALYLLSGEPTPWIDAPHRYRLRQYLRTTDAEKLTRLCRRRARTLEFWCRDSLIGKAAARMRLSAATGPLAAKFQLTDTNALEGYATADDAEWITAACRMKINVEPITVRLRVADWLPDGDGPMPLAVCAADLAESNDPRERRAGLETLEHLLEHFRRRI